MHVVVKGVFNGLYLSNVRELKSQKLDTEIRLSNRFWVIYDFLMPKTGNFKEFYMLASECDCISFTSIVWIEMMRFNVSNYDVYS